MYVNYTTPMQSKKKKGLMLCYINLSLDEKLEWSLFIIFIYL